MQDLEKLIREQGENLNNKLDVLSDDVKAIDISISGDEKRGTSGIKQRIEKLERDTTNNQVNNKERLDRLESTIPDSQRSKWKDYGKGAAAGGAAVAAASKAGMWPVVVKFFSGLFSFLKMP